MYAFYKNYCEVMLIFLFLTTFQERFALPMGLEAWTLRSIGKKWRSWKADLKATYFDPAVPNAEARFQKDIRVREEQWIKLWAYWKSEEAKVQISYNILHKVVFIQCCNLAFDFEI